MEKLVPYNKHIISWKSS